MNLTIETIEGGAKVDAGRQKPQTDQEKAFLFVCELFVSRGYVFVFVCEISHMFHQVVFLFVCEIFQMFHRVVFLFGLTQALECYTCGPEGGKVQHDDNKEGLDDGDLDGDDD